MKDFFCKIAALFALAVYAPNILFAGGFGDALQEGRKSFDGYLERAKVQTDRERFEKIAEQGICAALFEWERASEDLRLCELDEWKAQRRAFESELGEAAQEAFEKWLLDKKSLCDAAVKKSALYAELQKAAESFFYRDESGVETRIVSEENIQAAREQWEAEAQNIVQKYLEENSCEYEISDLHFAEEKVCNALMNRLLYDHDSLKKISAAQAALKLADSMAGEIEEETSRSIDEIFKAMEKSAREADSSDVQAGVRQGEDWLLQFERELQRGLQKWEDAETDFLTARAEWELSAEKIYADDSQKWQEAYNELQRRKEAWNEKITIQIQEGEREWQNKFSALDEDILACLEDCQKSCVLELEQKERLAQAQFEAYSQSRAILQTARSGIESWSARWTEKYKGLYSYWKSEDSEFWETLDAEIASTGDLKNAVQLWKRDFAASVKQLYVKTRQTIVLFAASSDDYARWNSLAIKDFYEHAKAIDSCSEFSSAQEIGAVCSWLYSQKRFYELLLGEEAKPYLETLSNADYCWAAADELCEWLDLFDRFAAKSDELLSDFCVEGVLSVELCGDLEVEKEKAAVLLDAWEERGQIARALLDYSENNFSDVESASQSQKNLDDARARFDEARAAYQALASLSEEKSAAIESAKEACELAMQKAADAMAALEVERQKYDEIYEEKAALCESSLFDSVAELCEKLNALNVPADEFKNMLGAFAEKERAESERKFLERVQNVRNAVENGSEGLSYDSSSLDELFLGEEFESARESLSDLDKDSMRTLSMRRLSELQDSLLEMLAAGSFEKDALVPLLEDLQTVDKEKALALKETLFADEELFEETAECVSALRARVAFELENLEAALLLLDGGLEEIHEFFDENEDFASIFEQYKEYSAALLREREAAARALVASVICESSEMGLEEYFDALDQAAAGLNLGDQKVLELYKAALVSRQESGGRVGLLQAQLDDMGEKKISLQSIDWHEDVFESYFMEGAPAASFDGFDQNKFDMATGGRPALLDEIQSLADLLKDPSAKIKELDKKLSSQKKAVDAAQKEAERLVMESGGGKENLALSRYESLCDEYNLFLEQCAELYQKVKAARLDWRMAQEIYFYGQNEYLRGGYDAEEKLRSALEKRDFFKAEIDALNEIQQESSLAELDSYKESYAQSCKARVLSYRYERELAAQKERVREAQAQERKAALDIARESSLAGEDFEVPAAARDLVSVWQFEDGTCSIALKGSGDVSGAKEISLKDYCSNLEVVETDIYGNEFRSSRAKNDALEFLESLETKSYGFADLALAAMFIECSGDLFSRAKWFAPNEDPAVDAFYKIGSLPDTVHGVNLTDSYHGGRMVAIRDAYLRVTAADGEADIAKYILFSEVNFSSNLRCQDIRQNALKAAALLFPALETKSAADGWNTAANVNFALAASFSAIACIPFVGAWAAPFAALFRSIAVPMAIIAGKLYETFVDVAKMQAGCVLNLQDAIEDYEALFANLKSARENTKKEIERLDILQGAKGSSSGEMVSWKDFSAALDCMLEKESDPGLKDYFYSICDPSCGQKTIKNFFEELSREEKFSSVGEAVEKMRLFLEKKRARTKSELDSAVAEREGDLSFDKASFCKNLLQFYTDDVLKSMPVIYGGEMEECQKDVFNEALELRNEILLHSAANKIKKRQAVFFAESESMEAEYSQWQENFSAILQTAFDEWNAASQKLGDGFNLWQSEWSARYQEADEEWQKEYAGFLEDKQNWICAQYMGAAEGGARNDRLLAAKAKAGALLKSGADFEKYAASFCDSEKFDRILLYAQNLSSFAKNDSYISSLFLDDRIDGSLFGDTVRAAGAQAALQEEMQAAAAKNALQSLLVQFEKALDECFDRIEGQNKGLENWELDMVRTAGYTVDPLIHRDAVSGSSLANVSRSTQWVHRYEWFYARRPDLKQDLPSFSGTSSHYIMDKAQKLENLLSDWTKEIFGSEASSDGGKLKAHIGEAPKFKSAPNPNSSLPDNLEKLGSGQLGLIMLDYQWNAIKNSAGYAELSKPLYDQSFFDLGIDGLAIPSIRDVVSFAFDVAGSFFPPFFFVKLVDDAIFAAVDIGLGFKTWQDALNDVLRQAAGSVFSIGIGQALGYVGSAVQSTFGALQSGAGGQLFDAAQKAALGYASGGMSNMLGAVDFVRRTVDFEQAADAWLGAGVWTGAAGTLLGGALNAVGNFDANGVALNGNVWGSVAEMNAAIGSFSGAALNAALTGDFSISLANVNGAGFIELGFKDGKFFGGWGQGGLDLSYGALSNFVQNAQGALRIRALKNGSLEDQALLNSSNLLAWSGRKANLRLAKDIAAGTVSLAFDDGAAGASFDGKTITLDKALLVGGNEGQARLASLAALQAAIFNGQNGSQAPGGVMSSMLDATAAATVSYNLLGLDAQADCADASLAAMAKAYAQNGIAGIYSLFADASRAAEAAGSKVSGLGTLLEQPFFQNAQENSSVLLGFSLSKDEYNALARKNAVERYVEDKVSKAKLAGCSAEKLEEIERSSREQAERDIKLGESNESYGYYPENYETNLANYGCTLATAAYLAYSITGNVVSLSEANEILRERDLFVAARDGNGNLLDRNGVEEKNCVGRGQAYAAAVNAIAGGDCLQADGANFSVDAVAAGRNNRQSIYERLLSNSQSQSDVYFAHLRVNQGGVQKFDHSVLLGSIDFGDGRDYKSSSFTVMDPWQGGKYSPKSWSDVTRADFYKLTDAGKELYALTRKDLREAAS